MMDMDTETPAEKGDADAPPDEEHGPASRQSKNKHYWNDDRETALQEIKGRWPMPWDTMYPQKPQVFAGRDDEISMMPPLKELFRKWHSQAENSDGWINLDNLPSIFKFALRRPLMSEGALGTILVDFGLLPSEQEMSPNSADPSIQSARSPENEAEPMDKALRRQLWRLYDDIQDGVIPLEEAPQHYHRLRLEKRLPGDTIDADEPIDSGDMARWLTLWGVPNCHIPKIHHGATLGLSSGFLRGDTDELESGPGLEIEERTIIRGLAEHIRVLRSSDSEFRMSKCYASIEEELAGFDISRSTVLKLLHEDTSSSLDVADRIWRLIDLNSIQGFTQSPHLKTEGEEATEAYRLMLEKGDAASEGLPRDEQMRDDRSRSPSPETKPSREAWENVVSGTASYPHDDFYDSDNLSSSPENGTTDDLWGLSIPTDDARKIAKELNLPIGIEQKRIRSVTKGRSEFKKDLKRSSSFILSKAKRKASISELNNRRAKVSKTSENVDIFAMEGESADDFISSHIDPQEDLSERMPDALPEEINKLLKRLDEMRRRQKAKEPKLIPTLEAPSDFDPNIPLKEPLPKGMAVILAFEFDTSSGETVSLSSYIPRILDQNTQWSWTMSLVQSRSFEEWHGKAIKYLNLLCQLASKKENKDVIFRKQSLLASPRSASPEYTPEDETEKIPEVTGSSKSQEDKSMLYGSDEVASAEVKGEALESQYDSDSKETSSASSGIVDNSSKAGSTAFPDSTSLPLSDDVGNQLPPESPRPTPGSLPPSPRSPQTDHQLSLDEPRVPQIPPPMKPSTPFSMDTTPFLPPKSPRPQSKSLPRRPDTPQPLPTFDTSFLSRLNSYGASAGPAYNQATKSWEPISRERYEIPPVLPDSNPSEGEKPQAQNRMLGAGDLPPASPKPRSRELPGPQPPSRPKHKEIEDGELDEGKPISSLASQTPQRPNENSPRITIESLLNKDPAPKAPKLKLIFRKRHPPDEGPSTLDLPPPKDSGVPKRASESWSRMSGKKGFTYARRKARRAGQSYQTFIQGRRGIRDRIIDEQAEADEESRSRFFSGTHAASGSSGISSLSKLFDKYRDNAGDEPDRISVEGSMHYLQDIGVKLDEPVVLAVLTELNAPTMGEFTREGFVSGWTNMRADTLSKQQSQIPTLRRSLQTNDAFFKKAYRQTFLIARTPGQKVLPLDVAMEYWRLLLSPPSRKWSTDSSAWLEWWIAYLEEKWKKSVSRDMWDQTGVFVTKCGEDESMSWWSEEGAWPGVIDDFVAYVKAKRATGEEMDVG